MVKLQTVSRAAVPDDAASEYGTVEDPCDFLTDPALFVDELPQPYRRINKLLDEIFDNSWTVIAEWEAARLKEASRIRAPIYDCALVLEEHAGATCLACSPDGSHIIVGLLTGLAVIDAESGLTEATWAAEAEEEEEGKKTTEIVEVEVRTISDDLLLIAATDKMGSIRLFAYTREMLFPLHLFNEIDESTQKIAFHCTTSLSADYIGIHMQDKSSSGSNSWLEIFRLPLDVWKKEIETVVAKYLTEKLNNLETQKQVEAVTETYCDRLASGLPGPLDEDTANPLPSTSYQRVFASQKFASPTFIMKLQPPLKLSGMTWSSPYQASKTVSGNGDVIGVGQNHLVSAHHLDNRTSAFHLMHRQFLQPDDQMKDIAATRDDDDQSMALKEDAALSIIPTFHFLLPGKLSSNSPDRGMTQAGQSTILSVWWSGQRNLMHYSLIRTGKETEYKADSIWPLSSPIVTSCTSDCSSFLALALNDNSLVVWNMFLGIPHKTIHLDDIGNIIKMTFFNLPSRVNWVDFTEEVSCSDSSERSMSLLIQSSSGSIYALSCATAVVDDTCPILVLSEIESVNEIPTIVSPIQGLSQLILIARFDGRIFLHDVLKCQPLCEIVLPESYALPNSSQRQQQLALVSARFGRVLYAIGICTQEDRDVQNETNEDENEDMEEEDEAEEDAPEVTDEKKTSPSLFAPEVTDEKKTSSSVFAPEVTDEKKTSSSLFAVKTWTFPHLDQYLRSADQSKSRSNARRTTIEQRIATIIENRIWQQKNRKERMQKRWSEMKFRIESKTKA